MIGKNDLPPSSGGDDGRPASGRNDAAHLHDMGMLEADADVLGEASDGWPQADDGGSCAHIGIATTRSNFAQLPNVATRPLGSRAMKTRGERLKYLREKAGFRSAREFAQLMGVPVSTYNAHERAGTPGARDFDEEAAAKYARTLQADKLWLLFGDGVTRGSTLIEPDSPPDPEALSAAQRRKRQKLQPGEVIEVDAYGGAGNGGIGTEIMVDGEVADGVRATWRMPVDFLHSELRAAERDVEMLPIEGDSMIPTLLPGDRVMINRRQNMVSVDGLYAIGSPFGVQVKRLEWVKGSRDPIVIRIISDNPLHAPVELSVDEMHVIGRVICRVTKL